MSTGSASICPLHWAGLSIPTPEDSIMKGTLLRNTLYAVAAASAFAMASTTATAEPLKIGFVYVSPIGEAGWTWQQDVGRREMEQALGDKVTTQYVQDRSEEHTSELQSLKH